jgi:hypothetical protein
MDNNVIFEALGCNAKATTKLAVQIGTKGPILLFLCDNQTKVMPSI